MKLPIPNYVVPLLIHCFSSLSGPSSPLRCSHVYPSFLPTHAVHLLYTTVLDSPHILLLLENNLLFEDDMITHELICLFHGISHAQRLQLTSGNDASLYFALDALPTHILNVLHSHGFGTFIKNIESCIIYLVFHHIYLSLPQDQCNTYLTHIDQFLLCTPCTLQSPSPILIPPSSLISWISSSPLSETSTTIATNNDDDQYKTTILISTENAQSINLPNSTTILSSPTQVLSRLEQIRITPATANTTCLQCFYNSHYQEDYDEYHCPHCHTFAPGHPTQ